MMFICSESSFLLKIIKSFSPNPHKAQKQYKKLISLLVFLAFANMSEDFLKDKTINGFSCLELKKDIEKHKQISGITKSMNDAMSDDLKQELENNWDIVISTFSQSFSEQLLDEVALNGIPFLHLSKVSFKKNNPLQREG